MRFKVLLPVSLQHSTAVFDCTMWRRGSKGLPSGDGKESNISSKIEQSNLVLFHLFMSLMFIILVVVIAFICYLKYCF